MIYKRNLRLPFMEVFDAPDTLLSCARREQSTHAPQALELLNGQTSNDLAAAFAERLLKERSHRCGANRLRLAPGRRPPADGRGEGAGAEVSGRRARRSRQGEGVRPGRLQPECIPVRELNMSEHIRYARNRREFLTDCFCGVGSLAFASMMAQDAGARRALQSAGAQAAAHAGPAKAKAFIFLFMAGGPSHLETFDPKPLLNQLDGQKRPAEFGDVKYQNVNADSRILGTQADVPEVRQVGHRSLRPVPAPGGDRRRPLRDPLDARRHGGALRGAVPDDDRPRHSGLPGDGKLDRLRTRVGSGIAAGLRRDARSARRAGSRPADVHERLSAGGLSADDVPSRAASRC